MTLHMDLILHALKLPGNLKNDGACCRGQDPELTRKELAAVRF